MAKPASGDRPASHAASMLGGRCNTFATSAIYLSEACLSLHALKRQKSERSHQRDHCCIQRKEGFLKCVKREIVLFGGS
jgi:RES domain-containing protein